MTKKPNGLITAGDVYELVEEKLEPIERRTANLERCQAEQRVELRWVRRFALAAFLAAASPKLGGPSVPQLATAFMDLFS